MKEVVFLPVAPALRQAQDDPGPRLSALSYIAKLWHQQPMIRAKTLAQQALFETDLRLMSFCSVQCPLCPSIHRRGAKAER